MSYPIQMPDADFAGLIGASPDWSGQSRDVFWPTSDRAIVIKRTKNVFPGANIIEWTTWHAVHDTAIAPLFARCISISPSGRYLMMEYLADTTLADGPFPTFPDWLTDRKRSAFGKDAQGQIKVRDYASLKLGEWLAVAPKFQPVFK